MEFTEHPQSPGSTSPSLIHGAKANEASAWGRLFETYGSLVYTWCRKSGLQPADAADVTQAVFTNVSRSIDAFDHESDGSTFRGWLRVITSNRIRDWARKNEKIPKATGGSTAAAGLQLIEESTDDDSSIVEVSDDPQVGKLSAILEIVRRETEDRTWKAFWRTTVEGRPAADVAEELGMKRQAVFQAKSRTLKKIKSLMADEESE